MLIDTDHLHYWMQAIRQSPDPLRTMDAFWSGQITSKEWLISNLKPYVKHFVTVDIHGGWVGVLASMLFQSGLPIRSIRSIDIDPTCEPTAIMMNKAEEIASKFSAITADMCSVKSTADIIINTSCEHISQADYELWLSRLPKNSLIVLQSNNYKIDEHIRTAETLEEFELQSKLIVMYKGTLTLPLYDRYLLIGRKS